MEKERPEELQDFEVTELEDADLEDVAGGGESNNNCGCNGNCGCPAENEEVLS